MKNPEVLLAILAAGAGKRMNTGANSQSTGMIKPLAVWHGKTLLERAMDTALGTTAGAVFVVLGFEANKMLPLVRSEIGIITNAEYEEGIASSIRSAIAKAIELKRSHVLIVCCDQPLVTSDDLDLLIANVGETLPIACAQYADTFGVPALFAQSMFPELLKLQGDSGAKKFIQRSRHLARFIPLERAAVDIDTQQDLLQQNSYVAQI